jgi:hypothetical protein
VKCPVCNVEVAKGAPGTVVVKVPVEGRMCDRPAHVKCIEEAQKSRTTVNRP